MKHITRLLLLFFVHLAFRTCWAFHVLIPEDTDLNNNLGSRIYNVGISAVFLLWALSYSYQLKHPPSESERSKLRLLTTTWLWFAWSDFAKEFSFCTGIGQSYFDSPLTWHISEYVIFGIAIFYCVWKWKKL